MFARVQEVRPEILDRLVFLEQRVTAANEDYKVRPVRLVNQDLQEKQVTRVRVEEMVRQEEVVRQERKETWYAI